MRLFSFWLILCGCASSGMRLPVVDETLNLSVAVRCSDKSFCALLCSFLSRTRVARRVVPFREEEADTYYLIVDVEHRSDPWRGEPSRRNASLNFWAYVAPWMPVPVMMNILPVVTVRVRNEAKVTLGFWTSRGFKVLRKEGLENPFVVAVWAKQARWLDRYWWTIRGWLPVSAYGKKWREIFFDADAEKIERLKRVADEGLACRIASRVVDFLKKEVGRR